MSQRQRYVSELQSYREGISSRVEQHRAKIDAVNQALGVRTQNIIAQGKKLADTGKTLLESGVGVVGAVKPLSGLARRGITSVGEQIKSRARGVGKDLAKQTETKTPDEVKTAEGKADDDQTELGDGGETKGEDFQARVTNAQEGGARTGELTDMRSTGQNMGENRVGQSVDDGTDPSEWWERRSAGKGAQFGEQEYQQAVEARDMRGEDFDAPEPANVGRPTTDADPVGDAVESLRAKAANTGETVTNADPEAEAADLEPLESTVTDVGADAAEAGTVAGAGEGFDVAAAATSWLAWLGVPEILGAIGAVAGVVSAGVGIADAVKGGAADTAALAAQKLGTKAQGVTQAAGSYAVPTQDSI